MDRDDYGLRHVPTDALRHELARRERRPSWPYTTNDGDGIGRRFTPTADGGVKVEVVRFVEESPDAPSLWPAELAEWCRPPVTPSAT